MLQLNGFAPAPLAIAGFFLGVRVFLAAHLNLTPRDTWLRRIYLHRRYLFSIRFVDTVIAVSTMVAEELRTLFPKKRIIAIPNWITDIPAYRVRRRDSSTPVQLLYVGRLVKLKGVHTLLEAIRQVPNVSLTIVGTGEFRAHLEALAAGLNVQFEGFKADPRAYYERADLFVMPSLGPEGLPMVSLEAMAHGLPCILSDLPVHQEISDSGRAAMLFEAGNVENLREKLVAMVSGPAQRAVYSQAAYTLARERYSLNNARSKYLEAFGL